MKRWMILLNRLAGFVVMDSRRRNHEQQVSCLHSMVARTRQAIQGHAQQLRNKLRPERQADKQPTRVESLEPRLLFSADLSIASFQADGDLEVQYDIAGQDAQAFDLSVYRSSDGTSLDALVATKRVDASADLTIGSHAATLDADFVDVQEDYELIAVIDAANENAETDETNNAADFAGGVFMSADNTIHIHGDAGADSVNVSKGSNINVTLNGTQHLYAVSSVSAIHLRLHGGNDSLNAGSGVNKPVWVFGGAGADSLTGGGEADYLAGGEGNDTLIGRTGDDLIRGGAGDDLIEGGYGDDTIEGGDGDDVIKGNQDDDVIYGGAGADTIDGDLGDDLIYGGEGDDDLDGNSHDDILYGEAGNDTIEGGTGEDELYGGEGDDTLKGESNPDLIYGGAGNDTIKGGTGADEIHGGDGDDIIEGESDPDLIYGDEGNDDIDSGAGADTVYGGDGDDHIETKSSADYVEGGAGADTIDLGDGNDTAYGGDGDDTIIGKSGADTIFGEAGDDIIEGDSGNNTLDGGTGIDTFDGVTEPNTAPTTSGIPAINEQEDIAALTIDLTTAFDDIEHPGTSLAFSVVGNTNSALITTASIDPSGILTIGPAADESGAADLTVRATDPEGLFVETTFTVAVAAVNDAPILAANPSVNVDEDSADSVLDMTTAFADVDDATLSYGLVGNTNAALFSSASVDAVTGQLVMVYAADQSGTADLTIRATDSGGLSVDSTVRVTVAPINDAPTQVGAGLADVSATLGDVATLIDLTAAFSDIDDPTLTYTIVSDSNPTLGTVFSIDPATGTLTLQHDPVEYGVSDITVRATDAGGLSVESTFTLTVINPNTPPTALGIDDVTVFEDAEDFELILSGYFADSEEDASALSYEVVSNTNASLVMTDVILPGAESPAGTEPRLLIALEPNGSGSAALTIRATDAEGEWVETTFTVTVRPVDDAPVIDGLDDGPDPAITGADLTLAVESLWDDSPAVKVDFYRDADGDGVLNTLTDELLGFDVTATDGWSLTVSTEGFELGQHRYYAIATDSEGQTSNVITSTGGVGIIGILDDAHPGYAETGTGWSDASAAGSYGTGHRQAAAGTGANTASWVFTGLLEDAPHRIYTTWAADSANATNATFTVSDGTGVLGTFVIDQTVAPNSYFDGNQWWHEMIELPEVLGTLTIEVTDDADGVVVADAIRVLDPPPTIEYVSGDRSQLSAGTDLLLTAYEVLDADGTVVDVEFFYDTNANGVLDIGTDVSLGVDTEGSDDYSVVVDTAGFSAGTHTFFARAKDNTNEFSTPKSFDLTVTAGATDGLVVHYKFDEASGSLVADSATSDGVQDGSYNGPRATGYAGNAINLNGVSQSVNITGYKGILGTDARTVAAWINTSHGGAVTHWGQTSTGGRWTLRVGDAQGGGNGTLRLETGNGTIVGSTDLTDGQWHHVAVVHYDAGGPADIVNVQLYVDGQLEVIDGSVSQTGAFSTNAGVDVRIGHSHYGKRFKGLIDDYRIYDKALTTEEVQSLAPTTPNTAPTVSDAQMGITGDGLIGQTLGTVIATDVDASDTLTFEIVDGNDDGVFAIDGATGAITQAATPDFAIQDDNLYNLTVKVTDNGTPALYRLANVTVEQFTESSGLQVQLTFDDRGETVPGYTTDSATDDGSQDGQLRGGVAFAEDDFGQWSANFNGVNQDVVLNGYKGVTGTQSRTLSTWVKTNRNGAITQWGDVADSKQWTVRIGASEAGATDGLLRLEVGGGFVIGSTDLRDNEWHHIAVVFENDGTPNANEVKLFVDGVEEQYTQKDDKVFDTGDGRDVRIGHTHYGTRFKGLMDDFRIYDRALTNADLIEIVQQSGLDTGITTTLMSTTDGQAAVGTLAPASPDPNATFDFTITAGDPDGLFSIDTDGNITINDTTIFDYAGSYKITAQVTEVGVGSSLTVINILPNELVTGLVGLWQFNEGTGSNGDTTEDLASGNTATLNGTIEWQSSAVGSNAVEFNGINTSVTVDGYQGITGTAERTVSAWIKTGKTGSILSWGNGSNGQGFDLQIGDADTLRLDVGGGHIAGSTIIRDSQWHHVAVVFDDSVGSDVSDAKLYVDGVEEVISTSQAQLIDTAFGSDVTFGFGMSGGRYEGVLDEVRLYDRALSGTEVASAASASNSPAVIAAVRPRSPIVEGQSLRVGVEVTDLGTQDIATIRAFVDANGNGIDDDGITGVITNDAVTREVLIDLDTTSLKHGLHTVVAEGLDSNSEILSTLSGTFYISEAAFVSDAGIDVVRVNPDSTVDFDLLRQYEDQFPDQTLSIGNLGASADGVATQNVDGTIYFAPSAGVGLSGGVISTLTYDVLDDQNSVVASSTVRLFIGMPDTPADFAAGVEVSTDAQGNPQYTMTITAGASVDIAAGAELVIDWGDGSQPQTGGITDNGDGTYTATHTLDNEYQVLNIRVFASDPVASGGSTFQAGVTIDQNAVPLIEAEVLSGSEVLLRWGDYVLGEAGFEISVSTDGGQSFSQVASANADASAALITGLADAANAMFEVTPVMNSGLVFLGSGDQPFTIPVAQASASSSEYGYNPEPWYIVRLIDQEFSIGEAGYTIADSSVSLKGDNLVTLIQDGVSRSWELVQASSYAAAVYKAVSASVGVKDYFGTIVNYVLGQSGSFSVDTPENLKSTYPGHSLNAPVQAPGGLIRIANEDTTDKRARPLEDNDVDDQKADVEAQMLNEPVISIGDAVEVEGDAPDTKTFKFTVDITKEPVEDVTAAWRTVSDTAKDGPGGDYEFKFGELVFGPGKSTSQIIEITVYGDDIVEPDENFTVFLEGLVGPASFGDRIGLGTIIDDDAPNEEGNRAVDIDTDSDNDGMIEEEDDDGEENQPGKVLYRDGVRAEVKLAVQDTSGYSDDYQWKVRLTVTDGKDRIKIWDHETDAGSANEITFDALSGIVGTWTVDTMPDSIWVEGIEFGEVELTLELVGEVAGVDVAAGSLTDVIALSVATDPKIDLDVDSNNDSRFNPPDDNAGEDRVEEIKAKVIDTGHYDVDGDSIPDYADGFDIADGATGAQNLGAPGGADSISVGERFVPIVLRLKGDVELKTTTMVTLDYDGSDPGAATISQTQEDVLDDMGNPVPDPDNPDQTLQQTITHYHIAPGALRVWKQDGGVARDKHTDYVAPNVAVRFDSLPMHNDDERQRILYVEGIQTGMNNTVAQQTESIIVTLSDSETPLQATEDNPLTDTILLELTNPDISYADLDIDSDNKNGLNRDDKEEVVEDSAGKITELSIRDLNNNWRPDFSESDGIDGLTFSELALTLRPPAELVGEDDSSTTADDTLSGDAATTDDTTNAGNNDSADTRADLIANAKIVFEYDLSDPFYSTGGNHTHEFDPYKPNNNAIRVWTKDGDQARSDGDIIQPGKVYKGSDFDLGGDNYDVITLWVEAVNEDGEDFPIKVTVTFEATTTSDPPYDDTTGGGDDGAGTDTTGGSGGSGNSGDSGDSGDSGGSGGGDEPTEQSFTTIDIVYVRPAGIDLDIDSDNNNTDRPDRTDAEDLLEDIGPGKVLVVNTSNRDGGSKLDIRDGFDNQSGLTTEHLVPLELGLPSWILQDGGPNVPGDAWIAINYSASYPNDSALNSVSATEATLPDGHLRIWAAKDGVRKGDSAAENAGGDFIDNAGASVNDTDGTPFEFGESLQPTVFGGLRTYLRDILPQGGAVPHLWIEAVKAPDTDLPLKVSVIAGTTLDKDTPEERDILIGTDSVLVTVHEPAAPANDGLGLRQVGDGADAGSPMLSAFLGGMRLDGQMAYSVASELNGDAFSWAFGHNRVWTNDVVARLGSLAGPGHTISDLPFLVPATSSMIAVFSPTEQVVFDRITNDGDDSTPESYKARFYAKDEIVVKPDNTIEVTDSAGNVFTFYGFSSEGADAKPVLQRGKLKQIATASGHQIDFTYDESTGALGGTLQEVSRDIGGVTEKLVFAYEQPDLIEPARQQFFAEPDPVPVQFQPQIASVTLKRDDAEIRKVEYTYYDEQPGSGDAIYLTANGKLNDLKGVEVSFKPSTDAQGGQGSWQVTDRYYYRYEYDYAGLLPNQSKDDAQLTQLIIMDPAAIARADKSIADLNDLPDDELVDDHGATRIRTHHNSQGPSVVMRGLSANESASTGTVDTEIVGKGGYKLEVNRTNELGPNQVRYTTTVTPFEGLVGLEETYELNAAREITKQSVEVGDDTWASQFVYDDDYRLQKASSPSGLTTVYGYFGSGDKYGLLQQVSIQENLTGGQSAVISSFDYADYAGVMRLASLTEHTGTANNTTSFSYSGTKGTGSRTTVLPTVSAAQHGSGQSFPMTETFDIHGRVVQVDNPDGTIDTYTYDPATMQLTTEMAYEQTSTTYYDNLGNIKYTEHPDGTRTYYHIYQTDTILEVTVQSGWSSSGSNPIGNITQVKTNLANGIVSTSVYGPNSGKSAADFGDFSSRLNLDTNPGPGLILWELAKHDKGGRLIDQDVNHIAGINGSAPRTTYEYDNQGRASKTHRYIDGTSKITDEIIYDSLSRVHQIMSADQLIQSFVYDDGGVGDGNVTSITLHPGGSDPNRETMNVFDWRNRLVASKQGVQGTEADINRPGTVYTYDNLDRVVMTEILDADGITPSYDSANGVVWSQSANGGTTVRTDEVKYDARGQVYETTATDPVNSYTVTAGLWYDAMGRVIKQKAPGGLTTKTVYDTLGRVTDVYLTDDASGNETHAGDTVVEHIHNDYDDANNVIFSKTTQYNHNGGANRTTAVSMFYDELDRMTAVVNHGTNGSTLNVQTDIARGNAAALRTDYAYSPEGRVVTITDPRGIITETTTDGIGRTVKTIQAKGSSASILDEDDAAANGNQTPQSIQRTTLNKFDGLGRLLEQVIQTSTDNDRTTEYIYDGLYLDDIHLPGHAEELAKPAGESLWQAYFQDYSYNALGEATISTSQAGTQQTNQRDVLGRLTSAEVQVGGNQSVVTSNDRRRLYEYDTLGNITRFTVDDADNNPDSVVSRNYNAFGQITSEAQDHDGDGTPGRSYTYTYASANGGVRPTGIIYTDAGRTFEYAYDNTLDNAISRITSVKEDGNPIESYEYLGLGTVTEVSTNTTGSDVVQTRTYDAFGRLASQHWVQGGADRGHYTYGYDSAGNLLHKKDELTASYSELFHNDGASPDTAYDALGRLQGYQRGALNAALDAIATTTAYEDWDADYEGVHRSVVNINHTLQNQMFQRPLLQGDFEDESGYQVAGDLETALEDWHDAVGSPSTVPVAAVTVVMNSWGNVAERKDWTLYHLSIGDVSPSGTVVTANDNFNTTLETTRKYWYDGLGRFITMNFDEAGGTSNDKWYQLYHDAAGNIIEETVSQGGSVTHTKTAVWSPVTGELIFEDQDTDNSDATTGTGLSHGNDYRYLTMVDGRGNTVKVLDQAGSVLVRLAYTPAGKIDVLSGTMVGPGPRHLFQQGWVDITTNNTYDGTVLRSGLYHDALSNGVLQVNPAQYWSDQTEVEPLPWYVQLGASIAENPLYALNEAGHFVLDVVGFIPGIGWIADLANAAWYTIESAYYGYTGNEEAAKERALYAGLSLAAAVPIAGYAAAGGQVAKYTGKAVRAINASRTARKTVVGGTAVVGTGLYAQDAEAGGAITAIGKAAVSSSKQAKKVQSPAEIAYRAARSRERFEAAAHTITLRYVPRMPRQEFVRKAQALQELGEKAKLIRKTTPRNQTITRQYRQDTIARIWTQFGQTNPEFANKLIRRVTKQMSPDHVHELQLLGPDVISNLRWLDRFTNENIGMRQIWQQIRSLPEGTPIRIAIEGL